MLRHVLSQSKEAPLRVIPRISVKFLIIGLQRLQHINMRHINSQEGLIQSNKFTFARKNPNTGLSRHENERHFTLIIRDMPNSKFPLAQ